MLHRRDFPEFYFFMHGFCLYDIIFKGVKLLGENYRWHIVQVCFGFFHNSYALKRPVVFFVYIKKIFNIKTDDGINYLWSIMCRNKLNIYMIHIGNKMNLKPKITGLIIWMLNGIYKPKPENKLVYNMKLKWKLRYNII